MRSSGPVLILRGGTADRVVVYLPVYDVDQVGHSAVVHVCVVGLLLSAGGFVVAILGASLNLSAGAVGIGLGVLGYFLGARRLGAASVVLGTAAVFFMAAASTGLIPGVTPLGHGYD
jgi:hypothetical protein